LDIPEMVKAPKVLGSKSDSWLLVVIQEVQVHFLLEEYRYDLDLEFRWLNEPPPEMHKKWDLYEKLKRRSDQIDHRE
jgi:ribosomal silencing factor RsfS